ncbi:DUF4253 domain-containing protein [Streptomyces termitum]|uniref:DUF4253 domain-containing protein n=1 Tax=Streptomyces termitum TaxID=67368 RepID=A0A918W9T4_9ACTN|nr:DUF4253 domain-containing protein [Streptomyces termitum]GHA80950.1 hypothetical protein GCM10010305_25950 [Streptomyces termitum]
MELGALRGDDIALPAGRVITADEGDGGARPLWLSDGPAPFALWGRLRAAHPRTGLWPLLLEPLDGDEGFRPWGSGELYPEDMSRPADHDPGAVLARWWEESVSVDEGDPLSPAERLAVTAPYGAEWPGTAPGREPAEDPDRLAAEHAEVLLSFGGEVRLGLVEAASGAAALAAAGWSGPLNHEADTARIAAVVADWERRFGARVFAVGFATLRLSVAAPPATLEEALPVAAEHFALCPDNVWQGTAPQTLVAYAERLVGADLWTFWWD